MKLLFFILSSLAVALALPQVQPASNSGSSDTKKFDGFSFRVALETNGDDKRYVAWVAGLSPCNNRNTIGKGTTSWCETGRETTVPYPDGGPIKIRFFCDSEDKQYNDVTYELASGQKGTCSHLRETFDQCGTGSLTTILGCKPDDDDNGGN